jgi:hypothetical protein
MTNSEIAKKWGFTHATKDEYGVPCYQFKILKSFDLETGDITLKKIPQSLNTIVIYIAPNGCYTYSLNSWDGILGHGHGGSIYGDAFKDFDTCVLDAFKLIIDILKFNIKMHKKDLKDLANNQQIDALGRKSAIKRDEIFLKNAYIFYDDAR